MPVTKQSSRGLPCGEQGPVVGLTCRTCPSVRTSLASSPPVRSWASSSAPIAVLRRLTIGGAQHTRDGRIDQTTLTSPVRRVRRTRVASSGSGPPARRSPSSPTTACTRCSTAARSRPASRSATAAHPGLQGHGPGLAGLRRALPEPRCVGHLAIGHARYSTTGAPRGRTPSRRSADTTAARSPSPQRQPDELRRVARLARGAHRAAAPTAGRGLARGATSDTAIGHGAAGRPSGAAALEEAAPPMSCPRLRGRLLLRVHGRARPCTPRATRRASARSCSAPRPRLGGGLRDGRARHRGRELRPRGRAGRVGRIDADGLRSSGSRAEGSQGLRVRVRLPGPPRHRRSTAASTRPASRWVARSPASTPVEADMVMPTPGVGHPGRDRVRAGVGHPLWPGPGQERLRRADLHPAQQTIRQLGIRLKLNPLREVIEGKRSSSSTTPSCAATPSGPWCGCCARPAPLRCTCGSPRRRCAGPASTASTSPPAPS
jgi:hypothetical protein